MSYKVWGSREGLLTLEGIVSMLEKFGYTNAAEILKEAERTRKASVKIGRMKVMLFKV